MPVTLKNSRDDNPASPGAQPHCNEASSRAVMSNPSLVYEQHFGGRVLNASEDAAVPDWQQSAGTVGKPW